MQRFLSHFSVSRQRKQMEADLRRKQEEEERHKKILEQVSFCF